MTRMAEMQEVQILEAMRPLAGFPARITFADHRTPEQSIKIPGVIQQVEPTGVVLELFIPLTTPKIGESAVLEVVGKSALTQCFARVRHTTSPQVIILELPEAVHVVQRRRHSRVHVVLPSDYCLAGAVLRKESTITNISLGGCAMVVTEPVDVGTCISLNLKGTGIQPGMIAAQVVRCTPSPGPSAQWEVGLSFEKLDPRQTSMLETYLRQVS